MANSFSQFRADATTASARRCLLHYCSDPQRWNLKESRASLFVQPAAEQAQGLTISTSSRRLAIGKSAACGKT